VFGRCHENEEDRSEFALLLSMFAPDGTKVTHCLPTERSKDNRTAEEKAGLLQWVGLLFFQFFFSLTFYLTSFQALQFSAQHPYVCHQPLRHSPLKDVSSMSDWAGNSAAGIPVSTI
jgi:hypothetical protein